MGGQNMKCEQRRGFQAENGLKSEFRLALVHHFCKTQTRDEISTEAGGRYIRGG